MKSGNRRCGWLALAMVCLALDHAVAQWEWRNPLPQGNTLTDLHAFSATDCYAAGGRGTFLATSSAGNDWEMSSVPGLPDISYLQFLDQANGILIGSRDSVSQLLKTTDGGHQWADVSPLPGMVTSAFFLSVGTGWTATASALLFTTDGGANWASRTYPGPGVTRLIFLDTLSGWALGKDTIYRTADGGTTWLKARPGSMQGWIWSLDKIAFVSPFVGWVTGTTRGPNHFSGHVFKSTDGGEQWTEQFTVGEDFVDYRTFSDLEVVDEQTAWAVSPGRVYKTDDAGETWKQIAAVPHLSQIASVYDSLLWGGGLFGSLYFSSDGGVTWDRKFRGTIGSLNDLHWVDRSTGVVAGDTLILKTEDGGMTWNPLPVESPDGDFLSIGSVWFVDSLRGWVSVEHAGGLGSLLSTSDGGYTWESEIDSLGGISRLYFVGENFGWVSSLNRVYRTTDGGLSWAPGGPSTDPVTIESLFFTSPGTGWAGGYLGLAQTTDGGVSWTTVLPEGMAGLYVRDIYFVTPHVGWLAGYRGNDGYIFKTEDGGKSWHSQSHPTEQMYTWFMGIVFTDLHHGWAVGESSLGGFAYRTTDGGAHWEVDDIPLNRPMLRAKRQERDIWILGANGAILRTSLGSVDVPERTRSQVSAIAFTLEQNYPNPFNPKTVVSSQLPVASDVRLVVYDLLGQEVAVLVNERRAAGRYRDTFSAVGGDARGLASGVYVYRLTAGAFVQSRTMMLLK